MEFIKSTSATIMQSTSADFFDALPTHLQERLMFPPKGTLESLMDLPQTKEIALSLEAAYNLLCSKEAIQPEHFEALREHVLPKHDWHAADLTPEANVTELLHILQANTVFMCYEAVYFDDFQHLIEACPIDMLLPDFLRSHPNDQAVFEVCKAFSQHGANTRIDPKPTPAVKLMEDYMLAYNTNIPMQPSNPTIALTSIITPFFEDTVFAANIHTAVGNAALFQAINLAANKTIDAATSDYMKATIGLYNDSALFCAERSESQYDQPMSMRDALVLLMTPRPVDTDVIEALSAAANINSDMLTKVAELTSIQRASKFKQHKIEIMETFDNYQSATFKKFTQGIPNVVIEHHMTIRYMRACTKLKTKTLNYTIKTSRLDRLGFFTFCDGLINKLEKLATELEFDQADLVLDPTNVFFLGTGADTKIAHKRIG